MRNMKPTMDVYLLQHKAQHLTSGLKWKIAYPLHVSTTSKKGIQQTCFVLPVLFSAIKIGSYHFAQQTHRLMSQSQPKHTLETPVVAPSPRFQQKFCDSVFRTTLWFSAPSSSPNILSFRFFRKANCVQFRTKCSIPSTTGIWEWVTCTTPPA